MRRPTPDPQRTGEPPASASLGGTALFHAKAFIHRRARTLRELRAGRPLRHSQGDGAGELPVAASIRSALRPSAAGAAQDRALTDGKIHNLRLAARSVDGIEVPAGEVFSFWAQVGPPTRRRGFVIGRELREGCLIPSIGGGLCQLSNALYADALEAGFEIIERHAHSRIVPGSEAEAGRDATIFWNYVDLRFRSTAPFRIEAGVSDEALWVALRGTAKTAATTFEAEERVLASECTACGITDCRRHSAA